MKYINLIEGQLYQCRFNTYMYEFDDYETKMLISKDDLFVYCGLQKNQEYQYYSHVFYHQKTMKYLAWSEASFHLIGGTLEEV